MFFLLGLSTNLEKDMLDNMNWIMMVFFVITLMRILDIFLFSKYQQKEHIIPNGHKMKDDVYL